MHFIDEWPHVTAQLLMGKTLAFLIFRQNIWTPLVLLQHCCKNQPEQGNVGFVRPPHVPVAASLPTWAQALVWEVLWEQVYNTLLAKFAEARFA